MKEHQHDELISKRLNELLDEKNMSLNRLATLSNLTQSTLNAIRNGRSKKPTIETLIKIANGLNMSLIELLDFEPYNLTCGKEESETEMLESLKTMTLEINRIQRRLERKQLVKSK